MDGHLMKDGYEMDDKVKRCWMDERGWRMGPTVFLVMSNSVSASIAQLDPHVSVQVDEQLMKDRYE
jgi:hypothetical protein